MIRCVRPPRKPGGHGGYRRHGIGEHDSTIGANSMSFCAAQSKPYSAPTRNNGFGGNMLLTSKTAIISGAAGARGIGFATAKAFADQGARVAILDLDGAGAVEAAAELGNGHLGLACNVTDKADCERAASEALKAFGQ